MPSIYASSIVANYQPGSVTALDMSLDGAGIVASTPDGTVHCYTPSERARSQGVPSAAASASSAAARVLPPSLYFSWLFLGSDRGTVHSLLFVNEGTAIVGSVTSPGTHFGLRSWDVETKAVRQIPAPRLKPGAHTCSRDGCVSVCASAGEDGNVLYAWNSYTDAVARASPVRHEGPIESVALEAAGAIAASGARDGTIRLWDLGGGGVQERLLIQSQASGSTSSLAFCKEGRLLISGGTAMSVCAWDLREGGRPVSRRFGHVRAVLAVAASLDGGLLASGGVDGTVRLWDARASGGALHSFAEPQSSVLSLALSASGGAVVAGTARGSVHLWSRYPPSAPSSPPPSGRASSAPASPATAPLPPPLALAPPEPPQAGPSSEPPTPPVAVERALAAIGEVAAAVAAAEQRRVVTEAECGRLRAELERERVARQRAFEEAQGESGRLRERLREALERAEAAEAAAAGLRGDLGRMRGEAEGLRGLSEEKLDALAEELRGALRRVEAAAREASRREAAAARCFECCLCLEQRPLAERRALQPCGHVVCSAERCGPALRACGRPCPVCRAAFSDLRPVFDNLS